MDVSPLNSVQGSKSLGTQPILTLDGSRAEIRLQRPHLHNRIQPEDLDMLHRLCDEIDAAPGVRVAILASRGKTFSAGFDIASIRPNPTADHAPIPFEKAVNRFAQLRVPTIAALQGSVYGGAADLALACDFRIGVDTIELRVPAAVLGVHYYASGLQRFVHRVGLNAAKRIFLLTDTLDAKELLRIGYLDAVCSPDSLDSTVSHYASRLEDLAPIAIEGMKRALSQASANALDLEDTNAWIEKAMRSKDLRTGLAAWSDRAKPRFSGI